MADNLNKSRSNSDYQSIQTIAIDPFTDSSFQQSSWKPKKWGVANPLHYRSVSSQFASQKTGRGVMCESILENAMACLLECDPEVTGYREQPIGPTWHDGLGWREGTARDFWVEKNNTNLLVETKYAKDLADPEIRDRLYKMAMSYRSQGIRMVVRTETTVFAQPRLDNCRILQRYANFRFEYRHWQPLIELVSLHRGPMRVHEMAQKVEPRFRLFTIAALCHMSLRGSVWFDMTVPISSSALVYWSTQ